ncbi:MAG: DUF262 domain-containing protein [Bacteroidaceae bacterium]|nr:DUF262 domain-containing protein [Bacteroidaceae bacterium]
MNIELKKITVRDLVAGYEDNEEMGVRGYGGCLDIRPPYQREFIYDEKKRAAVITTIKKNFPLNVMYWAIRDDDAEVPYEVMDGQQRTISICQYVNGDFAYDFQYFHNLTQSEQDQILDYELMVYFCSGNDKEKLDWFETINIAGERLTRQELRNAVYAGPFVSDAKRYFSKTGCAAYNMGKFLINGSPIRQDFLETALKWIANAESKPGSMQTIEGYMAKHQHDPNANQLWQYFNAVMTWVAATFDIGKRKQIMKGIDWGSLYDKFHNQLFDKAALDAEIAKLIIDSEVQNNKGICPYVLTRDEHYLGLRAFPDDIKLAVYESQHHRCANPECPNGDIELEYESMEGDHITPWRDGGRTVIENCQMLCKDCNRRKGAK